MRFAVRLSLPDRRGALSAVASAIGRAGANIVSLDVVGGVDGMAVDDLTVESDVDEVVLRRAIEAVPSVVVEAIRQTDSFRDPTRPLELAAAMVDAGSGAVPLLVEGLPEALWLSWAMVVVSGHHGAEIIHRAGYVADPDGGPEDGPGGIEAPWLPLEGIRRLNRAPWMPQAWQRHSDLEVVAAPLAQRNTAVLVGRTEGPRFLDTEIAQLQRLARIAVRAEVLGAGR